MNLTPEQQKLVACILSKVGDLSFKRRVLTILEYLDVRPEEVILDAGCGEGFYLLLLDQLYQTRVVGLENDPHMLDLAKNWLQNSHQLTFEVGDVTQINHPANYFDKVICTEVLEHIADDQKALAELFRVLKPGGVLALTVPNKNYPLLWDPLNKIREAMGLGHFDAKNNVLGGIWSYDHKRLYSPEELVAVVKKAGFEVETSEVLTHFGLPFNNLILYLGKSFYSKLPVPAEIKNSMEKFSWQEEPNKASLVSTLINLVFSVFKWVDHFNARAFPLNTSSVNVALKARKPQEI